jgi:hypothetical protein
MGFSLEVFDEEASAVDSTVDVVPLLSEASISPAVEGASLSPSPVSSVTL